MEVERMEVSHYREEICTQDEFWEWRAATATEISTKISKTYEDLNWKENAFYAEHKLVSVQPLGDDPVYLKGDILIVDPFKVFFRNAESVIRMDKLTQELQDLQQENHWEFMVMYRGHAAFFMSSESWDQDVAFEISRKGMSLGVDEVNSRFIALVPKKMVDMLVEENGEEGRDLLLGGDGGGVYVEGVDGQLIRSGDGDFVISGSGSTSPARKMSRWIEEECVWNADVLCAAGGSWTYSDDSSSDEEDDDDEMDFSIEELMEYLEQEDIDCEW
ncbi:unnamed protein product [Calypogeia fissa]